MKNIIIPSLAMAIGLALFQPAPAFAEDQPQKGKGQGTKEKAQAKSGAKAKAGAREMAVAQPRSSTAVTRAKGTVARADTLTTRQSTTAMRSSRSSQSVTNQTVINQNFRSFNRANNFGGRWFAGNIHPDWSRDRAYWWGGHQWRWYDGGWLIIDGGYWPPSYAYSDRGYGYASSSTVMDVQRRLGDLGYYGGYADGIMGPVTHNAIANYQRDHGLAVTGRINNPLLASLGIG